MKHRLQGDSAFGRGSVRVAAGVLPMAIAVAVGGVSAANASSAGSGTGNSGSQPGITTGPGVPVAAPNSPAVRQDQAAPSTDYAGDRPVPVQRYAAPVNVGKLHAPVPVRPVAPIVAPPGTIRVGDAIMPAAWMPAVVRDRINVTAAGAEAQVSTFARSIGVSPNRSDRIAGSAAVGGLVTAVPGALVGGTIGGAVGGAVGVAAGLVAALGTDGALLVVTFLPGLVAGLVANVPEIGAAATIGTVGGAAVGGAIGGAITGLPGALIGGAVGAAT